MIIVKCTNVLAELTDELINELCMVANSQIDGAKITLKFLLYRMQSPQECEALRSLDILDSVSDIGGYRFFQEIGSSSFIDDLIKIIRRQVIFFLI